MSRSLPSRGAWIEMAMPPRASSAGTVAPLAGSVDRNVEQALLRCSVKGSLPSRGAWIEMGSCHACGVRNDSRSPRGERG